MKYRIYNLLFTLVLLLAIGTSQALASSITPWATTGGGSAQDITIDSSGNLYVTNSGTGTVAKITPAGVSSILGATGSQPRGIVIDTVGNIYTANYFGDSVTKITPAGVSTTLGTAGPAPFNVVVDSLGNVYTANLSSATVTKITPAGVSTVFATLPSSSASIAIDASGNLYLTNASANTVIKVTPAGVVSTLGSTGVYPLDIAVDAAGNVYTANQNSNTVTKITPAGVSTTLGTTGAQPSGITIDSAGNVYTANYGGNTVTKITPAGVSSTLGTTGSGPTSVVVDIAGNIYAVNSFDNTVTRITRTTTTPELTEVTPVATPTIDFTPSYTFEALAETPNTLTYGGACSSATTTAVFGNNTINFSALPNGTYSDCTITVTDTFGVSNVLAVTPFTISNTCTYGPNGAENLCNGLDDDCDGSIDENYSAGMGCVGGLGQCEYGELQCSAGVENCVPYLSPAPESCNGLDDDCDGTIDNGGGALCDDSNSCTDDVCNGALGCESGAVVGTYLGCIGSSCVAIPNNANVCADTAGCVTVGDACTCVPTGESEGTCNGADDDCDGVVDEDFASVACTSGLGICEVAGNSQCIGGVESCDAVALPAGTEVCNGLDDNCDGVADDTATDPELGDTICDDSDTCTYDYCNGASGCSNNPRSYHYECQGNACVQVVYAPGDSCFASSCEPSNPSVCGCVPTGVSEDICNGVDDDCDGGIDENYLNVDCVGGVGICAEGTSQCNAGVTTCQPDSGPQTEQCDGFDNDCDGTVDNGGNALCDDSNSCTGNVCQTDGNGATYCAYDATPGTYFACISSSCVAVPNNANTCTNLDGCTNPGDSCTCTPSYPGNTVDYTCNGVDDDCDGLVDEDWTTSSCSAGIGACLDPGTTTCSAGVETCDAVPGSPQPIICDFSDQDCNGVFDADQPGAETSCDDSDPCTIDLCNGSGDGSAGCHNDVITYHYECAGNTCVQTFNNAGFCPADTCNPLLPGACGGAVCGDGNTDPGETCDDSNLVNGDGCNSTCQSEICGNNVLDAGEACDDGNVTPGDGCSATCQTESCGDGITNGTEQCDDANLINTDACTNACTLPICGDSIVNGTDQCDDGNVINTDACTNSCLLPVCGDSIVGIGEACDDGNIVSGDGCSGLCAVEICGDGIVQPGEQCDDANGVNTDACTNACTLAVCGDSFVQVGETCDDGNLTPGDGCSATCTNEICGNGTLDPGEACDDANLINTDACTNACTNAICGDSFIQPGETCDDSNLTSNDGCSATCQTETCGDGITNGTEQCDDANLINTDACTNLCLLPVCGDTFVQVGETCDDGNVVNNDGCSATCTFEVCGDGVTQLSEQCDDANVTPGDGCSATCTLESCGNGVVEGLEQCDDANLINTDACTNACLLPVCGDGITNGTEACDDGNLSNIDTCTILCILTADPGITKTVDNPNPDLDGIISYFITVTNNGPATATGVVVTDILPPGLTLITANVTGGVLTLPTWTLATMAPATTETLTITASVDVTNPITNIATVTSTSPDIDPLNNQDQVTITPQSATVQGHLFRDDNENQLQDVGEADLPNISVRITDRNSFLRIAVTDAFGDYTSIIPPGAATLEIDASDPDFPDDYVITVDTLLRTINALPGINPVHFFGIDIPDTVTTKNTKDKKKRSITVTLQRTLVATGIPLEAGAALGYFSLLAITALSLKRTRRW